MNKKYFHVILPGKLLLLFVAFDGFAQSENTVGHWVMAFNQTRLTNRVSLHTEIQYRSYQVKPNTEQWLLRGGINYHINNSAFASFGYANINNFAADKDLAPGSQSSEHRLWQQFLMRNKIDRIAFEHRYRLEQRWIKPAVGTHRYLNRIRYLLRVTIPVTRPQVERNTLFISIYDEVFLHLTSPAFDRNRLYGAVGYQFSPITNLQLGWLAQTTNAGTRYFLQTALIYNPDLRKSASKQ
jgi:hypothetical protein